MYKTVIFCLTFLYLDLLQEILYKSKGHLWNTNKAYQIFTSKHSSSISKKKPVRLRWVLLTLGERMLPYLVPLQCLQFLNKLIIPRAEVPNRCWKSNIRFNKKKLKWIFSFSECKFRPKVFFFLSLRKA